MAAVLDRDAQAEMRRRALNLLVTGLLAVTVLLALVAPAGTVDDQSARLVVDAPTLILLLAVVAAYWIGVRRPAENDVIGAVALAASGFLIGLLLLVRVWSGLTFTGATVGPAQLLLVTTAALLYRGTARLASFETPVTALIVPALFGGILIYLWEVICVGYAVPGVLLPPPSQVADAFVSRLDTLAADFVQTFLKSILAGYFLGCGFAFAVAIAVDRSPFLQRGLMPIGTMVSAMPIIGIAPIMVMWFGFDWQSKAAVVVIMTFFPMLVNTLAGLSAAGQMERDLMRSYAAGYWQTLIKLRLPAAMPFIFNALKLNSTLALIGAIVAEFFGTPIVGMGFRISSEIGRLNVDMVWATIAVAALAGSASYGLLTLIERAVTFWHPTYRR